MDGAVEPVTIASIVEGHGEVKALPKLLHRLAVLVAPGRTLRLPPSHRIPKSKLLKSGELEAAVDAAGNRVTGRGGILVLLDSDDDCPAQLGPDLLERATRARSDKAIAVVVAKREFEAWFLAAAPSLVGTQGLPARLEAPDDPEGVRGAKEWLTKQMAGSASYSPTVDQPTLVAQLDLDMARQRSHSFDKLWRDVERLVGEDRERERT